MTERFPKFKVTISCFLQYKHALAVSILCITRVNSSLHSSFLFCFVCYFFGELVSSYRLKMLEFVCQMLNPSFNIHESLISSVLTILCIGAANTETNTNKWERTMKQNKNVKWTNITEKTMTMMRNITLSFNALLQHWVVRHWQKQSNT